MSLSKKKRCNPPAQRVAATGDPLVLGLFEGAGAGLDDLPEAVRDQWAAEVVAVEEAYIDERLALAARTCTAMKKLFASVADHEAAAKKRK